MNGTKGMIQGAHRKSIEQVEREHILLVLDHVGWHRARAAAILQLNPTTLWRKLKAWGVRPIQEQSPTTH